MRQMEGGLGCTLEIAHLFAQAFLRLQTQSSASAKKCAHSPHPRSENLISSLDSPRCQSDESTREQPITCCDERR
jgi:hypothetical protein